MKGNQIDRAREILKKDKLDLSDGFNALLTGDISSLLSHYFTLVNPFAEVKIKVDENGFYLICIKAIAGRVKDVPTCLPELD